MDPELPSIEDVEDTAEVYLNRHSKRSQAVYLAILALLVAGIVALPLVRVSVSVGAAGILRPTLEVQEVRAGVGGEAVEVRVRRGDRVERGDVLLVIGSGAVRSRVDLLARQRRAAREEARDLDALLAASDPATAAVTNQELRWERDAYAEELARAEVAVESARAAADRARAMAGRGLVSTREMEDAVAELSRETAHRELVVAGRLAGWERRREDLGERLAELDSQLATLWEELGRYSITAPVGGTIEDLAAAVPGRFVQQGDVVATISPDQALVAEAYVSPADVGLIREGIPARMHIDAFNYLDWGYLTGDVEEVSADYVLVGQQPAFRVLISLHDGDLRLRSGLEGEIRKGMTFQARFLLAERSLLQLLRDDINQWAHPWQTPAVTAMAESG